MHERPTSPVFRDSQANDSDGHEAKGYADYSQSEASDLATTATLSRVTRRTDAELVRSDSGREALVNAFRHSRAENIEVEVEYAAQRLRILVRDDGCGIDPQVLQSGREGHWGLAGMCERAEQIGARLKVRSRAVSGTEVELSVPRQVAFQTRSSGNPLRWPLGCPSRFCVCTTDQTRLAEKGGQKEVFSEKPPFFCPPFSASLGADIDSIRFAKT